MLHISPGKCIDCTDNNLADFLRNAYVLFSLIGSPWPFVLVMIEAIALWMLVIANCHRSIPEVIEDGVMGSMIDGLEAGIRLARHFPVLSRNPHRLLFEVRFKISHMAEGHLSIYQRPLESQLTPINPE